MPKAKVLAISGSLRKASFTENMLDLCVEGMGEVELRKFYPHKMNIQPCTGCFHCWTKAPGECVHKDDFRQILDAYLQADYFLWAAPLYIFSVPATVKNVIDRFFICLRPEQLATADGMTMHPKRYDVHPKAVLISSCGFPELENFDLLRRHFSLIAEHMEWVRAGELLIPGAGAHKAPKLFDHKYELLRQAGAELAAGTIRAQTTQALAEPVMPREDYWQMVTAALTGELLGKAKIVGIAAKAIRQAKEGGQ